MLIFNVYSRLFITMMLQFMFILIKIEAYKPDILVIDKKNKLITSQNNPVAMKTGKKLKCIC